MRSLFNYESKFMQILLTLADLFILNLVFLLCCIPLFTIGAAQVGLYSGLRRLLDTEDDRSCLGAFFKGFANGFKTITLAHLLFLVVIVIVGFSILASSALAGSDVIEASLPTPPAWLCVVALAVCALFHSMLAPFHANFSCTTKQLIRNAFFVTFAYPLHGIAITALIWLPVIVLLLNVYYFMLLFPLWGFIYYSLAYLFVHNIMKKPFAELKSDFLEAQQAAAGAEAPSENTTQAEAVESEPQADAPVDAEDDDNVFGITD